MNQQEESSDVRIARLEEKLDNLIKSVDSMTASLENLRMTFVPRTEFDQLSVVVKGVQGTGGLVKVVEKLDNKVAKYVIIIGIAWFIFVALIIGGWQYFLVRISVRDVPTTTTTNTTTNNH